jgi:maltoporin
MMKTVKMLPLAMAVVAALCPISVLHKNLLRNRSTPLWRKPSIKRWPNARRKSTPRPIKSGCYHQPADHRATPDMAIPFGLKFSGYARYGAQFQTGDQKFVGVDGSYNGASAIGRNEGNGGEFQITKAFKSSKGAIWDINVMFDHWSDEVNLKKPTSASPTCWSPTPTPISGPAATSTSVRNRGSTTTSG